MAGEKSELERQLAESEQELERQKSVLGVLEQWRSDLLSYGETEVGLLDERAKLLSGYTFAERGPVEEPHHIDKLPETFTALGKFKGEKLQAVRKRIDDVIERTRSEQGAAIGVRTDEMIIVDSLSEFDDMTEEVKAIRSEVEANLAGLSKEDRAWYDAHPWDRMRGNDRAELTGLYNSYGALATAYEDAERAYKAANSVSPAQQAREEFDYYKTLVARRFVLKQVVKNIGMKGIEGAEDFTSFSKLGDEERKKALERIEYNLMSAAGTPDMTRLGYASPEFAQHALRDYLTITDKVKAYQARIRARRIPAQVKWLDKYSADQASRYLKDDGTPRRGCEELIALSAEYDPFGDMIERREQLKKELDSARMPYYKASLAVRLLQKEAIKKALVRENARIDEHNAAEDERFEDDKKWKDQDACDERFRETVERDIAAGRARSVGLMAGTMLTGFAGRMTEAFGDSVSSVGAVLAQSIIKGETRQIERELADLEEDLQRARQAVAAGAANASQDRKEAREDLSQAGTVTMKAADAIKSNAEHLQHVTAGAEHVRELERQKAEKQRALEEARSREGDRLAAVEVQFADGRVDKAAKDKARIEIESLGNSIMADSTGSFVTSSGGSAAGGVISEDTLKALMAARTNLRQRDLMNEEADVIRRDRKLQASLADLREYSDRLSTLMRPENLEKVDTVVSVAQTFFDAYQKVNEFVRGKAGTDGEEKSAEEAEEEEQEESFQADVRETLDALNKKAEQIKASMAEKEPDRTTLVHDITELTMECGGVIRVLSKKINDFSAGLESELEETQARTDADRELLEDAKKAKGRSVVALAKEELETQKSTGAATQSADLAIRDAAIETQRRNVTEAERRRDELKARVEAERKAGAAADQSGPVSSESQSGPAESVSSTDGASVSTLGTSGPADHSGTSKPAEQGDSEPAPVDPSDPVAVAVAAEQKAKRELELAAEELERKQEVSKLASTESEKRVQEYRIIQESFSAKRAEIATWQQKSGTQAQKNAAFLESRRQIADKAAKEARINGVKSTVYDIASNATQGVKGFMDQLTVGVAEAVVKGRTKQLEDDLAEKEKEYQLKGKTIMARNRSAARHTKNAEGLRENSDEWRLETRAAAAMRSDAERLVQERGKLGEEIRSLQDQLAEARVREQKELADLDDKLRRAYGVDREAMKKAERETQAQTKVNALQGEAAVKKVAASTGSFEDVITSASYTVTDAAQREQMTREAGEIKRELAADERGRQLMEISDGLRGLFTPKNLSRVDSIVDAAEGLYKLYGKARELTEGGEQDASEDEQDLASSVRAMRDKAADLKAKLLSGGEDTHEVVDSVLELADNMRDVTDQIARKVEAASKEANLKWIESREISQEAETEYSTYSFLNRIAPQSTIAELTQAHLRSKMEGMQDHQLERVRLADEAVLAAEAEREKAQKDYDSKKEALDAATAARVKAEETVAAAKKAEEAAAAAAKKADEEAAADARQRLEKMQDILENLRDTGRGYTGHSNSKEYNDVMEKLQSYLAGDRKTIDPDDPATTELVGVLSAYLDHTGMDTAWHKSGNIRKENILACLDLIDHETALTYEAKANKVRSSRKKISLDTLAESENVKRAKRPAREHSAPEKESVVEPDALSKK